MNSWLTLLLWTGKWYRGLLLLLIPTRLKHVIFQKSTTFDCHFPRLGNGERLGGGHEGDTDANRESTDPSRGTSVHSPSVKEDRGAQWFP